MIVRRPIPPKLLGEEVHEEIAVVDGVRMFIEKYKRLRWGRLDDLRILSIGVKFVLDDGRVLLIQISEASVRERTARAPAVAVVVDAGNEPRIPHACEKAIEFRCIHVARMVQCARQQEFLDFLDVASERLQIIQRA